MAKSWTYNDQGFLVESRVLEGGVSLVEQTGVEKMLTLFESISILLQKLLMFFSDRVNFHHAMTLDITFINTKPHCS